MIFFDAIAKALGFSSPVRPTKKTGESLRRERPSNSEKYDLQNFIDKFIELYEKDWIKIEKTYFEHLRKTKPGKKNPMPKPEQYLKNMLNVWNKNNSKND